MAVADASWTYYRMEQMQKRLPEIMLQKPDTDGGEEEDDGCDPVEAAEENYDVDGNEDAEAEP